MPGETGEVSSIGVKLTLDAGEFMGGMKAAQGSLNTFQQQAAKAGSGAGQLKAGGGKQAASGPSSAQSLTGINVSLVLSDQQLAGLRKQVQGALQNIPITVTTQGAKAARAEAQSVVAAVSTPAIGTRSGAAHAVDRAVRQNLPQKAHGGPVQAGRAVIVGEHRPEVFIPRSHGHIEPDATRFYREQERFRRREAELAALNYQTQRRHEREMGRIRGGGVRGYGGKYGASRPLHLTPETVPPNEPGFGYHGTIAIGDHSSRRGWPFGYRPSRHGDIRGGGRYGTGIPARAANWMVDDIPGWTGPKGPVSFWSERPGNASGYGTSMVRTRLNGSFSGPFNFNEMDPDQDDPVRYRATAQRTPLSRLQYWGEDNDWHRFRKGRARFAGGPVEGPLARRLREGAYRPAPPPPVEQPQPTFEPEWMRRAREQRLPPKVFRMAGGPVRTFTVADPMGLHMRPSSVLAQVAQRYPEAAIQIHNLSNGEGGFNPRSMMGWAQLMAIPGDEIQMIGNEGSELALHQLARLGGSPKLTGLARRRLKRRSSENWAASHAWRGIRMAGGPVSPYGGGPYRVTHKHRIPGEGTFKHSHSGPGENHSHGPDWTPVDGRDGGKWVYREDAPKRAGAGAIALRATLANEGGTFPLYGGPQPPKGYAVGIETGTSQLADPNDPRDFFRKYNAQRKAQMAAGDFPPFVGTWLHEGQIHIDPAAVLGRRREADLVARAKSQLAFFDLKRFDEIPTSSKKMRSTAERVNELIMSGRKRQEGGPASAFRSSGKPSELMHRYGLGLGSQGLGPFEPGPGVSHDIDRIRGMTREHWLGVEELVEGRPFVIGEAVGDKGSVSLSGTKMRPGIPAESQRRWRNFGYGRSSLNDTSGLIGIHNHPLYKGSTDIWRPSLPDIRTMFAGEERESWVVTPQSTQIMRPRGHGHRDPGQIRLARSMAEELAQGMGVREEEFIKPRAVFTVPPPGARGLDYFTPAFIKAFSSKEVLQSFDLQRRMLDRAGEEYGFDWELWKHPPGPYTKTDPAAIPRPSRVSRPSPDQLTFGMMAGGSVRGDARRARAYGITHAHGNIKGWENAQWRHQEMLEIEDARRAARAAREPYRIPGFAPNAWETFPLPAEPLVPLTGETGKLWGDEKRAGGPVHAKHGAVVGRMTQEELDFAGNLRAAAARISPDQMKFGKAWYADAQNWINEQSVRYGIDPTTVRGVTAALSAGTSWQANKTKAHRVLQTHRMGLFGESFPYNMRLDAHGKAKAILEGADPERILGHTPKVGPFYRNLGGDLDALTLDRWAFRTATRGHLSAYGEGPVRNDIDAAYRQVAAELGLHPVELQAASWLYEKETNPRLGRKGKPQSLGQLEGMFSPMHHRASGGVAVAGQPHGLVHPGGGMISQIFQTAADWANDPFMAIMSYQSMQQAQHRQAGGPVRKMFTVADELGLHMRPSAHLARMAADYDAVITIQNMTRNMPSKGTAQAKYMHHWLALGASQGNQIMVEASGRDALNAVRGIGGMLESPGLTRIASANRSLEKVYEAAEVDPARLRAAEIYSKLTGRAGGGKAGEGLYIVGEIGPELFVPNRLAGRIPKKVMDQIPRAANGGIVEIGRKRNELFAPPEDGIIIPNRLIDQIPHAYRGIRNPEGAGDIDPMWSDPKDAVERLVANLTTPQMIPAPLLGMGAIGPQMRGRGNVAMTPDVIPIGAGGVPAITATTVNVTASGATTVNTQNATAAGAAGAAAAQRTPGLPPGFQGIGGIAVPHDAGQDRISQIERQVEAATGAGSAEAIGSQYGYQTVEGAAADYRARIEATTLAGGRAGPTTMRGMKPRLSDEIAVQMAGAGKTMPSRTPQGAIAAVGSFLFGGVQQLTQAQKEQGQARRQADRTTDQYNKIRLRTAGAYEALAKEVEAGTVHEADFKTKTKEFVQQRAAARAKAKEADEDLVKATQKALPTTAGIIRNLGVIIGATSAYGMAMQAASMVIDQAIIPAAGKWIDEMTGWTPTFTRVSTAMADTTRQMGGNYKAAVASAAATAGLSNETETWTEESLKAATMAKAGSKAFTEAKDLIAASMGSKIPGASNLIVNSAEKSIQMFTWGLTDASAILDRFKGGPAGAPQGLYGGYGGVGGTALFGEQLGGGSGFQQQITDLLKSTRQNDEPVKMAEVGVGLSVAGPVGAAVAVGAGLLNFFRGNTAGGPGAEYTTGTLRAAQGRAAHQEGVPAYGIRRTQGGEVDRLKAMGSDKTVVEMAELGYVYTDSVGNLVANLDELNKAVIQAAKGMTIPEMGTWFKTITRQMVSQFQMLDIKSEINRTLIIPLEYATSRIAEPLAPPGTGLIPGALPVGRMTGALPSFIGKAMYQGLGASERGAGWLADAARMQRELRVQNKEALDDARARIVEMYTIPGTAPSTTGAPGVPVSGSPIINANTGFVTGVAGSPVVNPRTGFTTGMAGTMPSAEGPQIALWDKYIAQAKGYSAEIQSINNQIGTMSAILNQTQWANASRLAHRALADARDYWKGVDSQGGKSLGAVQKRLWDIGRAQTSLGLQLQQRAITTNLAVAQFQAPGETGEERYFRQKEAIAKAGIEQQQLDLGVEAFKAQGKEWSIVAQRNIKDLSIQADVTEQQIALDKDRLAADAKIAALTDKMGLALKNASDIFGTAESKFEIGLGGASKYVETFGGTIKDALVEIWKGLGYTVTEGRNGAVNVSGSSGSGGTSQSGTYFGGGYSSTPTSPSPGAGYEWNGYKWVAKSGGRNAMGYLGTFGKGALMTVGEAGPETVAILRNPRAASMSDYVGGGGGGGSASVTVNINGPVVRNDQDISSLAIQVAAEVERSLSRKGQMFGLRGPAV